MEQKNDIYIYRHIKLYVTIVNVLLTLKSKSSIFSKQCIREKICQVGMLEANGLLLVLFPLQQLLPLLSFLKKLWTTLLLEHKQNHQDIKTRLVIRPFICYLFLQLPLYISLLLGCKSCCGEGQVYPGQVDSKQKHLQPSGHGCESKSVRHDEQPGAARVINNSELRISLVSLSSSRHLISGTHAKQHQPKLL